MLSFPTSGVLLPPLAPAAPEYPNTWLGGQRTPNQQEDAKGALLGQTLPGRPKRRKTFVFEKSLRGKRRRAAATAPSSPYLVWSIRRP